MFYKLLTLVTILGCLVLLFSILLEELKGMTLPFMKPLLWVTILAFLGRVIIRRKMHGPHNK